jgi:hypothetical protein
MTKCSDGTAAAISWPPLPKLLDVLGYPRAFPHPSPQCLEQAARLREAFTQELHSPEGVMPKRT